MNTENIMVSEISQEQTRKCCTISLIYEEPKIVKFIDSESGMVLAGGQGEEERGELPATRREVCIDQNGSALENCSTGLYLNQHCCIVHLSV